MSLGRSIVLDGPGLQRAGAAMGGIALLLPLVPVDAPGCPLRMLTGIPCPLCGMTTSVVAVVHGDLPAAVASNPAGPLVVLLAIALLVLRPREVRIPAVAALATALPLWVYQLSHLQAPA